VAVERMFRSSYSFFLSIFIELEKYSLYIYT